MNLPRPRTVILLIVQEFCGDACELSKYRDTHGEVRAPYKSRTVFIDCLCNGGQVLEPSRSSRYRGDLGASQPLQIERRAIGRRELNRSVHIRECSSIYSSFAF